MKRFIGFLAFVLLFALSACTPAQPPELSITNAPAAMVAGSEAVIHVKVTNPGSDEMQDCSVLLGYAPENDPSMVQIAEIPFSLAGGETFEQDVTWLTNFQPNPDTTYQIKLALVDEGQSQLVETSVNIQFVEPVLTVSIDKTELAQGDDAVISIGLTNPGEVDIKGYTISVVYAELSDPSGYVVRDLLVAVPAGGSFSQEIPWKVDYIPASGSYEIRAGLLLPESVLLLQTATPITMTAP